jgi:4'-phosphopantetheinyl transferase
MNDNLPPCAGGVPIALDESHVWKVRLDMDAERYVKLQESLVHDERQRADEFQLDAARRRFAITRVALRSLLGRYLGTMPMAVKLCVDRNGKPRIDAAQRAVDVRFNVAHSGELALIAVTRNCEVGVDVEQLRPVRLAEQIARRYFHALEIQSIDAASPTGRDPEFLRCWTAKEAVLKAVGTGITGSLSEFCVSLGGDGTVVVEALTQTHDGERTQCYVQQLDVGKDYLAAIAFVGPSRKVRLFNFDC